MYIQILQVKTSVSRKVTNCSSVESTQVKFVIQYDNQMFQIILNFPKNKLKLVFLYGHKQMQLVMLALEGFSEFIDISAEIRKERTEVLLG